ncbi:MAG: hypothetical protein PHC53_02405 [Patescibacteria group bacterium]|nr:hypothetical protein [Patescibacteria group bacterium]
MRQSFETQLRQMNEIARDKAKPDNTEEQRKKMDIVLDYQIEKAAERFGTPEKTQATIFKLQKRKQKVMAKLKEQLAEIDNPFEKEATVEGASRITYQDGQLFCGGREITLGELLTDGEWGLDYHLDPASVPRVIRKKYFIEQARREIMELLDRQIVTNESQSESVDELKKEGYIRMIAQENQEQSGKYAERMVKNLLKKIAIDQGLDIEISDADAYQDMELKIDFIIKRKMAARGVNVETNDEDRIGIQFTSTDSPEIVQKKERQIRRAKMRLAPEERIRDIALISIPLREVQTLMREWNRRKQPGGPDKLWRQSTRADIFSKVMRDLLTANEIEVISSKI